MPYDSETSNEFSKHIRIGDAEIWTKSHLINRDSATNDGLAEQDKTEVDRHDNLLCEVLWHLANDGIIVLLVSRRIDTNQCAIIIPELLWIDCVEFGHTFERRLKVGTYGRRF